MKSSQQIPAGSSDNSSSGWKKSILYLLSINTISVIVLFVVLTYIKKTNVLLLSAIPILFIGWFFNKRAIFFSTFFIFISESIYIDISDVIPMKGLKSVMPGVFTHTIFTLIALFINKIKTMGEAIKELNEQLVSKNEKLKEMTLRDPLTQLHNRRYAYDYLFEYAEQFIRQLTTPEVLKRDILIEDKVMLVILADIDNFKNINDHYGHGTGDLVLVEVARKLCDAVRFDDIVIRWGGEEFLFICPLVKKEFVEKIIAKVLQSVRKINISFNEMATITVSVSLGAICFPPLSEVPDLFTFDQAILLCDKALYDAKNNGRNQARHITLNKNEVTANPKIISSISMEDFFENPRLCSVHVIC